MINDRKEEKLFYGKLASGKDGVIDCWKEKGAFWGEFCSDKDFTLENIKGEGVWVRDCDGDYCYGTWKKGLRHGMSKKRFNLSHLLKL